MKYAICTPIAIFCYEFGRTPQDLIAWLKVGSVRCGGIYENARRIHNLLARYNHVSVVDTMANVLPNKQTPSEWADYIVTAEQLGFK